MVKGPVHAILFLGISTGLFGQTPSAEPPYVFSLAGLPGELAAVQTGAAVTPTQAPTDVQGLLTIRGRGAVAFSDGGGMSFTESGQQNTNVAFLQFTGAGVQKLFDTNAPGRVSFTWRSRYSLADRLALQSSASRFNMRTAVDAHNDAGEQVMIETYPLGQRLVFIYKVGDSPARNYFVAQGQEDAVFGKDVLLKVSLAWDGAGTAVLSFNGAPVDQISYLRSRAPWRTGSFTIGAHDIHEANGGFYASDDVLSNFEVYSAGIQPDTTPPDVRILTPVESPPASRTIPV
jgi:hypothetical protein